MWHTTDDKSQVEISKTNGVYFGTVIQLREPNWPANDPEGGAGKAKNDRRNPNAELRSRPIIGLQIMEGFRYAGDRTWTDGHIYDPESGNTYHGRITLRPDGRLELRGYVGISLFGRTVVWTR